MRTVIFRVIIDTKEKEDCYRDIEVKEDQNLEDFYFSILKSFNFSDDQMASMYTCSDEWDREEEFPLLDMGNLAEQGGRLMDKVLIKEVGVAPGDKLILVYDYMKMWTFLIEMINENFNAKGSKFPKVVLEVGTPPKESSKKDDFDDLDLTDDDQELMFEKESKKSGKKDDYDDFDDVLDLDDDYADGSLDYDDADYY